MATIINMDSILKKAQKFMGSKTQKQKVNQYVDKIMLGNLTFITGGGSSPPNHHTPEEAAQKFIEVLRNEILSHAGMNHADGSLGETAISALLELDYTTPSSLGDGKYMIGVYFRGDLSRESLMPTEYPEGIQNIAALLNNGYSANHTVFGTWHGSDIHSLTHRQGLHFVSQAISDFMGNYGTAYGVLEIKPDDIYN